MWEFRLIELLTYPSPFIDTHLHCLDDRNSVFKKLCLNIFIYLYGFLSEVGAPHL
jgi:hypothetical protein